MLYKPWKCISKFIDDKPRNTERAKFYSSKNAITYIEEIKYIYTILGYLDSKASSLMRFDGIILAIVAIELRTSPPLAPTTIAISAVVAFLILASIACCVLVIDVSWPFLSLARPDVSLDAAELNEKAETIELRKVLYFRERAYRWAWTLAAWAMVAIFVGAILFFSNLIFAA